MIFTLDKLKFQIIFPSVSLKTQSRLNVSNIIFLLVVNDLIREEVFVFIWSNDFLHDPSRKDQRRGYLRKSLSICLTLTALPLLSLTCQLFVILGNPHPSFSLGQNYVVPAVSALVGNFSKSHFYLSAFGGCGSVSRVELKGWLVWKLLLPALLSQMGNALSQWLPG